MNQLKKNENAAPPTVATDLTDFTQALMQKSKSPNTIKAYTKVINRLRVWLEGQPLTDVSLANYIGACVQDAKSLSLINMTVAAVKFRFIDAPNAEIVGPKTKIALEGARRESKPKQQVDGLVWDEVEKIVFAAGLDNTLMALRDTALFKVASDGLMRISEIAALDVEDLDLSQNTILIRRSKTDQTGEGKVLFIGDDAIEVLQAYIAQAGIENGALFRRLHKGDKVSDSRLSANGVRYIIQQRSKVLRDDKRVSGHSLRVGSAISLAQAGATLVDLQDVGRWKSSEMPAYYTRKQAAQQNAIARFKHGKERR